MEDWNFKQIIGMTFMIFSGLVGIIVLVIFLCTYLRPEIVGYILLVLMMIVGIGLWVSGSRENDKKD